MTLLQSEKSIEQVSKSSRGHFRLPIQQKSNQSSANSPNILQLLRAHHVFVTDIRRSLSNWVRTVNNVRLFFNSKLNNVLLARLNSKMLYKSTKGSSRQRRWKSVLGGRKPVSERRSGIEIFF